MTALATYVPHHLSLQSSIQDIAQAHLLWLGSAGHQGKRANFRGADLKGQVFHGLNFSQASFRNASMHGVRFIECNLEEADFAEADISFGQFEACHLKLGNFSRTLMYQAAFVRCAMEKSVFLQAVLEATRFDAVNLREANFRETAMPGATVAHTEMQRATMRSVNAERCHFEHVRLDGVDAKEARFDYTHFAHVAWYGSTLRGASFENAECNESDISLADEVDASAVAAVERTMAQLRAVEFQNIEKLQLSLKDARHTLEQRTNILQAREKQMHEKEMRGHILATDLARGLQEMRSRGTMLRVLAAVWFTVSAALITLMVHQLFTVGLQGLNILEIVIVALGAVFLMALFYGSAVLTHRTSSNVWKMVERLEESASE